MMLGIRTFYSLTLTLSLFAGNSLALPGYGRGQTIHGSCFRTSSFDSDFCDRCASRGITDLKICTFAELGQSKADGLTVVGGTVPTLYGQRLDHFTLDGQSITPPLNKKMVNPMTRVAILSKGITYEFMVNVDSCRRVNGGMIAGPLGVEHRIDKATIGEIANELFRLKPKDAIELVFENARQGKEEVSRFLQSGQVLDVPLAIELNLNSSTIKALNAILCKGLGGTATWLTVQAVGFRLTSHDPTWDQTLTIGAIATWAVAMENAVIDWLTEVLEKEPSVAAYQGILWIVQSIISRIRALVQDLPPLPRLDRGTLDRYIQSWGQSLGTFNWPAFGVTSSQDAQGTGPHACDIV